MKPIHRIHSYLTLEDVLEDDQVISAWTVYQMTYERLFPLYEICHNKNFENQVESLYMKKDFYHFYQTVLWKSKGFSCKVNPFIEESKLGIDFVFCCYDIRTLYLDMACEGIHFYFDPTKPDFPELLQQYENEIYHTFLVLETYRELFHDTRRCDSLLIDVKDLTGKIHYNYQGEVSYSFGVYLKDPLYDLLMENAETILKKIPVRVDELPTILYRIYQEKEKVYSK